MNLEEENRCYIYISFTANKDKDDETRIRKMKTIKK